VRECEFEARVGHLRFTAKVLGSPLQVRADREHPLSLKSRQPVAHSSEPRCNPAALSADSNASDMYRVWRLLKSKQSPVGRKSCVLTYRRKGCAARSN
jgi:hypothetical protein